VRYRTDKITFDPYNDWLQRVLGGNLGSQQRIRRAPRPWGFLSRPDAPLL